MHLTAQNVYPCSLATAYAMLTDPDFLAAAAQLSNPNSYQVSVTGGHTRTERNLTSEPPASRITGATLDVSDEVIWDEPSTPNEYTGNARVEVAGLPISLQGTVRLFEQGDTTVQEYVGELIVKIPLLGALVEKQAAPVLLKGLSYQQNAADSWLVNQVKPNETASGTPDSEQL